MKRKILLLTGLAISLFLLFIAAGAGIFTGSSENTQETENNLVAEISKPLVEERDFRGNNYSFLLADEILENSDKAGYKHYKSILDDINSSVNITFVKPEDAMLSYQEATNIGVNIAQNLYFKRIYFKDYSMICLVKDENIIYYIYSYSDGEHYIILNIDAITGEVVNLTIDSPVNFVPNSNIPNSENINIPQDVMTGILKYTIGTSYDFGYGREPEIIEVNGRTEGGFYHYSVIAKYSDNNIKNYTMLTNDNDFFELSGFSTVK